MAKQPKPWYRKSRDAWYVCLAGKQILLAKGKSHRAVAEKAYHELMLSFSANDTSVSDNSLAVAALCEAYLEWCHRRRRTATYEWYLYYLQDFAERVGRLQVRDLRPYHLTRWIDAHEWNNSTVRGAITCVKRVCNWAVEEGLIKSHEIGRVKRPPAGQRKRVLSDQEMASLTKSSDPEFADFLVALRETGARPCELRELVWTQVDLDKGICVLDEHKTSTQTGEPRLLLLTGQVQRLLKRRKRKHPHAHHVFLNRRGEPWSRNAIRLRMKRLRKKLGLGADVVAYSIRHTFGTKALLNGVDLKTVSQLMGHSSVETTEHYLHLATETQHLKAAIERATEKAKAKGKRAQSA